MERKGADVTSNAHHRRTYVRPQDHPLLCISSRISITAARASSSSSRSMRNSAPPPFHGQHHASLTPHLAARELKLVGKAELEPAPEALPVEASLMATIVFSTWWWIAGLPVSDEDNQGKAGVSP
jgi:hypothetical protein